MNINAIKAKVAKVKENNETIELMETNLETGYMVAASQEIIDILVAENAQIKNELAEAGFIMA